MVGNPTLVGKWDSEPVKQHDQRRDLKRPFRLLCGELEATRMQMGRSEGGHLSGQARLMAGIGVAAVEGGGETWIDLGAV